MEKHLLTVDNFYFGRQDEAAASLNISVYQEELISICSSSSLCVDSLKEAYINHKINGILKFQEKKSINLTKGGPIKYIYSIFRNAKLVSSLSITDNIFSLRKYSFTHILYNPKYAGIAAADLMGELHLPIDINTPVSELSEAEHHLILLAKAYVCSAKLIFMDNIAEYYTYVELRLFLDFIKLLQTRGVTFLIFTNGPSLLTQVSDRIFVTRNYEITNILYHEEYSDKQLASMMLGGDPQITSAKHTHIKKDLLMTLDWSAFFPKLPQFNLYRQECLCVFNYNGSSMGAIYDSFTKHFPYILDGKRCVNYISAVKNGLAPVTLSKIDDYIFPELSLSENLTVPILKKISRTGIINKKLLRYCIHSSIKKIGGDYKKGADSLPKIVLLRWLLTNPKLMVISDLNVTETERPEIYPVLNDINTSGTTLIILSSNLYDCLYFADSLLVIKNSEEFRFFHKTDSDSFVQEVKSYLYREY